MMPVIFQRDTTWCYFIYWLIFIKLTSNEVKSIHLWKKPFLLFPILVHSYLIPVITSKNKNLDWTIPTNCLKNFGYVLSSLPVLILKSCSSYAGSVYLSVSVPANASHVQVKRTSSPTKTRKHFFQRQFMKCNLFLDQYWRPLTYGKKKA